MSGNSGGNARDNRQRGNAAQLHEKYKSMARDAQLSGDRVQTEYYLQFADHYFRMLGDARPRFDEQKRNRDDDQDDDGDDRLDSDMDNDGDGDDGDMDEQPQRPQPRPRADREPRNDRETRSDREPRGEREPRRERPPGIGPRAIDRAIALAATGPNRAATGPMAGRATTIARARRDSAPTEDERIDFAVLPPAIGTAATMRMIVPPVPSRPTPPTKRRVRVAAFAVPATRTMPPPARPLQLHGDNERGGGSWIRRLVSFPKSLSKICNNGVILRSPRTPIPRAAAEQCPPKGKWK